MRRVREGRVSLFHWNRDPGRLSWEISSLPVPIEKGAISHAYTCTECHAWSLRGLPCAGAAGTIYWAARSRTYTAPAGPGHQGIKQTPDDVGRAGSPLGPWLGRLTGSATVSLEDRTSPH